MHSRKAPFFTRLGRLFRLAGWLFRTGKHLRRIDAGNPAERDHAVITLGKGALEALDIETIYEILCFFLWKRIGNIVSLC